MRRCNLFTMALILALVGLALAPIHSDAASPAYQAALDDIRATLGSVPSFFTMFPEDALPGAWETMKSLQLSPETAIPPKYKELIGLAVAAQIPCDYCVHFHTAAAKLNGATEQEIREAVGMASLTRFWSTVANGSDQDQPSFRAEVDRMVEHIGGAGESAPPEVQVTDAASAYADIEATFGFVPSFVRSVPEGTIAAIWKEWKALELSPATAIPNKYKSLISVAVASQIPCSYCIYADRKFGQLDGVTEAEISEAVGLAAVTRHWSTFLNGMHLDLATFQKETNAVFEHVRAAMAGN